MTEEHAQMSKVAEGSAPPSRSRVVTVASLALALTAPGQTAAISAFVNPLEHGLHLSGSQISAAYLVGSLAGAWTMPFIGHAVDRFGVRLLMCAVGVAFGAVLVGLSMATGMVGLTAGFIGIRLLGQGALNLIATTTVAIFVERRRGLAQGLTAAIGGAGISLPPMLLEGSVATHGFRTVWLAEGLVIWLTVIPLALFGIPKSKPSRRAPVLEDIDEPVATTAHPILVEAGLNPGWTLRQAMHTGMFWLVACGVGVSSMLGTGLAFHQIDILGERGLSPAAAAANFLPQTVAGLIATVLTGYLADRISDQLLIVAAMLVLIVALVAAGFIHPGWSAYGYAAAVGTSGNAIRALEATAFPNCFGLTHIGAIRGFVHTGTVAASAFGPLAFSLGRQVTTSYRPVMLVAAALPLLVAVVAPTVPRPRRTSTEWV